MVEGVPSVVQPSDVAVGDFIWIHVHEAAARRGPCDLSAAAGKPGTRDSWMAPIADGQSSQSGGHSATARRLTPKRKQLFGIAAGTERNAVADDRADRKSDRQPA